MSASIESVVGTGVSKGGLDYKKLVQYLLKCLEPQGSDCPKPFTFESPEGVLALSFVQSYDELKVIVCDPIAQCVASAIRYCLNKGETVTLAWIDDDGNTQCFELQSETNTKCKEFLSFCGFSEVCVSSKVHKITVYCNCEPTEQEPQTPDPINPINPNQYIDTGCVIKEPIEFCDDKAWFCTADPGSIYRFDAITCEFIKVPKMGLSLGKPSADQNAKLCESVRLPFECVNDTDSDITQTCEQLVAKALAGAAQNGLTWNNGDPITGDPADFQFENEINVCVACETTPITLDDGSVFTVKCDAGSLIVNPNGGTNSQSFSCGSPIQSLGGGPLEAGKQVGKRDTITIIPGGGITGEVVISRCRNKQGELIDCTDPVAEPVEPVAAPSIDLRKTADVSAVSDPVSVGDVITYNMTATNNGNVDLTGVDVTDPLGAVTGGPVDLAVGASAQFTLQYSVTQADINAGEIVNTATATGTDPDGNDVTDTSDDPTDATTDVDDPTVVSFEDAPSIVLLKTADTSAVSAPAAVGDVVTFSMTATNNGNVDLTGVNVEDPLGTVTGGPVDLAVGVSAVFTMDYVLTQADLDAQELVNQATTSGVAPDGQFVGAESSTESSNGVPEELVVPLMAATLEDECFYIDTDLVQNDPADISSWELTNPPGGAFQQGNVNNPINGTSQFLQSNRDVLGVSTISQPVSGLVPGEMQRVRILLSLGNGNDVDRDRAITEFLYDGVPYYRWTNRFSPIADFETVNGAQYVSPASAGTLDPDRDVAAWYEFDIPVTSASGNITIAHDVASVVSAGDDVFILDVQLPVRKFYKGNDVDGFANVDDAGDVLTRAELNAASAVAVECVEPEIAEIDIQKTVTPAEASVGDTVLVTIGVTNTSSVAASDVVVSDPVPNGLTYNSGTIAGGDSRDDINPASALIWTISSLAAGASQTVTFEATVETSSDIQPTGGNGQINFDRFNFAEITGDYNDNNSVLHLTPENFPNITHIPNTSGPAAVNGQVGPAFTDDDQNFQNGNYTRRSGFIAVPCADSVEIRVSNYGEPAATVTGGGYRANLSTIDIAGVRATQKTGKPPGTPAGDPIFPYIDETADISSAAGTWASFVSEMSDGRQLSGSFIEWRIDGGDWVLVPDSAFSTVAGTDGVCALRSDSVSNTASADASNADSVADSAVLSITSDPEVPVPTTGEVLLEKVLLASTGSGLGGTLDVGDTLNYQLTVTNPNDFELTNVVVTDNNATVSGGPIASLAAGASDSTTFTAARVLTAADIAAGQVLNQAEVSTGEGFTNTSNDSSVNGDPDVNVETEAFICPQPLPLDFTGVTPVFSGGDANVVSTGQTVTWPNAGTVDGVDVDFKLLVLDDAGQRLDFSGLTEGNLFEIKGNGTNNDLKIEFSTCIAGTNTRIPAPLSMTFKDIDNTGVGESVTIATDDILNYSISGQPNSNIVATEVGANTVFSQPVNNQNAAAQENWVTVNFGYTDSFVVDFKKRANDTGYSITPDVFSSPVVVQAEPCRRPDPVVLAEPFVGHAPGQARTVDLSDNVFLCPGVITYGAPTNFTGSVGAGDISGTAPSLTVSSTNTGEYSFEVPVLCDGASVGSVEVTGLVDNIPNASAVTPTVTSEMGIADGDPNNLTIAGQTVRMNNNAQIGGLRLYEFSFGEPVFVDGFSIDSGGSPLFDTGHLLEAVCVLNGVETSLGTFTTVDPVSHSWSEVLCDTLTIYGRGGQTRGFNQNSVSFSP